MYKTTAPENQQIVWCEFNDKTKTIFYDQRVAISQLRDEPVVWSCSKVEDMNVKGIARYTWKQDKWDEHRDYIEFDDDGNLVGIWCSYFDNDITPSPLPEPEKNIRCEISYKGVQNNQFKVGGSARTFVVTFYQDDEEIAYRDGSWSFVIDGNPADELFTVDQQEDNSTKIKFVGSDNYMGKTVNITFKSENISNDIQMNIVGK